MAQPRAFKLRQAENRPSHYIGALPEIDRMAFISVDEHRSKWYYYGHSRQAQGMVTDKFLSIPGAPFDSIVIERLKALEKADWQMKDKVKATLEQVYDQQSEDFVSIHQQIEGIQAQLVENAKKRMKTSSDDPMYAMLQEEAQDLLQRQKSLEAKKEKLGLVDSPEEIEKLHRLLGNFEAVWPTFDLDQRQRAFSLLINRIEVEVVSPHWIRLSIDWLDAISPRLDIAYLWKWIMCRILFLDRTFVKQPCCGYSSPVNYAALMRAARSP